MDILALVTSWWITTEVRERRHTDVSRTILIFLRSFAYNKQRENQEVNNLNILKCPNCGWNCVSLHKTPHGGRYYIGCANCHWVGPQKFFRFSAILAWNKESKRNTHTTPQQPRQRWAYIHR